MTWGHSIGCALQDVKVSRQSSYAYDQRPQVLATSLPESNLIGLSSAGGLINRFFHPNLFNSKLMCKRCQRRAFFRRNPVSACVGIGPRVCGSQWPCCGESGSSPGDSLFGTCVVLKGGNAGGPPSAGAGGAFGWSCCLSTLCATHNLVECIRDLSGTCCALRKSRVRSWAHSMSRELSMSEVFYNSLRGAGSRDL